MPRRCARQWWWAVPVLTVLCAGCGSSQTATRYDQKLDACRLPDPVSLARLVPGTVELPEGSVHPPDAAPDPDVRAGGDNDQSSCRKIFGRDLGGGQPDTQDYRIVTVTAIRYTDQDNDSVAAKVQRLMTAELGDHSGVRLVSGVGDEAGVTDHWATVRSGNVVLVLTLVDAGSEAALIAPPKIDDVQQAMSDFVKNLQPYKA